MPSATVTVDPAFVVGTVRRRVLAVVTLAAVMTGGVLTLGVTRLFDSGPRPLELSGDLAAHDPALVVGQGDDPWFVYSTGDVRVGFGAPQIRRSDDGGHTWEMVGTAWDASGDPSWVRDEDAGIAGVESYWAPELYEHDGTWYLYYSASTFGSNTSAIGVATGTTLDPDDPGFGWTDQGVVVRSTAGEDDYNAIDPGVVEDAAGNPWLFFGSFWGGIQAVPLQWPSGKVAGDAEPVPVAARTGVADDAIEAPYVAKHDGWYYLFASFDRCCSGVDSTYSIHVGRSRDVTGPYVDRDGTPMLDGGGTTVLASDSARIGPGGQSLSGGYLGYHFYDAANGGAHRLAIQELGWQDGWPVATPEVPRQEGAGSPTSQEDAIG